MKKIILCSLIISLFYSCKKTEEVPKPVAAFTWQTQSTTAPATVSFTNASTNATSYSWDFGDGNTSTSSNPTNRYSAGGNFVVKLTATGPGGTNTSSQTISLLNPTSLQISIKDNLGNAVSGATVKLYSSLTDWTNETNQVLTTQTSNTNGVVTFSPLSPAIYYWKIMSGCQTNLFGSNTSTTALTANINNTVTSVLGGTGTLTLNNNSTNPYDIYVNGILQITNMSGGSTRNFAAPVGNYTIRVIQKSGFILSPTDKTYTGSLICGGTLTVAFP
jgi:PKD repeat protein